LKVPGAFGSCGNWTKVQLWGIAPPVYRELLR
jgi:hypothetical protein